MTAPSESVAPTWQEQMLSSVNSLRNQKLLSNLSLCKPLIESAQKYADTMARKNFLAHTGKDGSSAGDRIQRAGYDWKSPATTSKIGENIAGGQRSVKEVMSGWVKSAGRYKNIMDPDFTHVGFGKSSNSRSKYKIYWVQNFGAGANC